MAYSTPQLVRHALAPGDGSSPDEEALTGTAADLSDPELTDAINEADALIDSYLGVNYVIPVVAISGVTPHPIDYYSRNIAAYNATLTYRKNQNLDATDPVNLRYLATMAALTSLRDGKSIIDIPVKGSGTSVVGAEPGFNPYTGDLFGMDDWSLAPVGESHLLRGSRYDGRW